jgi:hypothetical protein
MGCTDSKPKNRDQSNEPTRQEDGETHAEPPDAPEGDTTTKLATAVGPAYWQFIKRRCHSEAVRVAEWQSFLSTLDFLIARDLTATRLERRAALDTVAKLCPEAPVVEPLKVVDESIGALLEAWMALSDEGCEIVSSTTARSILRQAKVYCNVKDGRDYQFSHVVELALQWTTSSGLANLFFTLTHDEDIMSADQLVTFASYGSTDALPIDEAKDVIAKRLGGSVTLLRFLLFFGNPATNDVLDPKRAKTVWQDMSQPLTRYSIATRTVSSKDDVASAAAFGTRAFVVRVHPRNGVVEISPGYTLTDFLQQLKASVFKGNPLPVVLCFMPDESLTVTVQDQVAEALEKELGDSIATGLMFRGSNFNDDPKFTPLGLQNRFLILAQQGPLRPFVGFSVADMQRHGLGVRVTAVPEGTPASRAGIGKTDWLTHFNGEPIESKENLKLKLATLTLGEEFRVRKEGLTEVTGIVGAAVAQDTVTISKRLSSLLFLNLVHDDSESHRLPWDTEQETLPFHPVASTSRQLSPSSTARSPLHEPAADHFRFIPCSEIGADDVDERERAVADADSTGVQFIDTHHSAAAARWARGKFADNGHCGYVLQRRHAPSSMQSESDWDSTQRVSDDAPTSIHIEVELLAVPTVNHPAVTPIFAPKHDFPTRSDLTCSVAVIGTPERRRVPLQATASLEIPDPTGKVLLLRTATAEGRELEAALPAHLIRPGYRIVSFVSVEDVSLVYPVLCAIKRHSCSRQGSAQGDDELNGRSILADDAAHSLLEAPPTET